MNIRLDEIRISDFKRIQDITIELSPITALVGSNTSGKSSALQAAQVGVSVLQAAFKGIKRGGIPDFARTVSNDSVLFRPTEHLLDLRSGSPATQDTGYLIEYIGLDLDTNAPKKLRVKVKRGKNANIALTRTGDDDFASLLADGDKPFSIFTPGLSGIPVREEWHTKGAMDAAVMHGDANLYLRTVLDHLFSQGLDESLMRAWKNNREIEKLPNCGWKTFSRLLDRCFEGARVVVNHDPHHDRYVHVSIAFRGSEVTLDMASTGMLQIVQILAYSCFYRPPLLLLDEPDAHLHADSQSRLYEALRGLVLESETRVLFATHSPQMIQRMINDPVAKLVWMEEGALVEVNDKKIPAVPLLMNLGALSVGSALFDARRKKILLTEDTEIEPVRIISQANGATEDLILLSYGGCSNLPGARILAATLSEARPDASIIIHRDRDFRTKAEMEFELSLAEEARTREGVERVVELFTPLNDVEHSFTQLDHLEEMLSGVLTRLQIEGAMKKQISLRRDDFIAEIREGRKQIDENLYQTPRKMNKPQRKAMGVPDTAPNVKLFLPANGVLPVEFEFCHGKKLLGLMIGALRPLVQKANIDIEKAIMAPSRAMRDPRWIEALSRPAIPT